MTIKTDVIYDVDLAINIKSFIFSNLDMIDFDSLALKDTIITADNDDILRIGKTINSPIKIVSVDLVDANFFRSHLFKNGNED